MNRTVAENMAQAEAIRALHPENDEIQIWIVEHFAPAWREILCSFERNIGRVPTAADLIWCLGVTLRTDPREVVIKEASKRN